MRTYGEKARVRREENRITLQIFMDTLKRFHRLGKVDDDDDDEVNQLKYDIMTFCKDMMAEINEVGLMTITRGHAFLSR